MTEEAKILAYAAKIGSPAHCTEKVATTVEGDVYVLGDVDKSGLPLPTGLPRFVIKQGESYKLVDGLAGLKLLESLDLEE